MIYAGQFYDKDEDNDVNDVTDALWCQSANNVTNIGVWYYPNGTEVPLFDGEFGDTSAPSPVFSKRFSGQIALARSAGLSGYEGLYKCIIPDENGVDQTLVVGAYTDTGYNNNDGPDADPTMQLSLLSTSRLATPPVFSLSFNVSDGPPTTVSCSVNGNGISTELSHVIVNGSGSVTRVRVTVRLREAGNYQCTVFNTRVINGPISGNSHPNADSSTSSLSISVSDTPTGLTVTRLSTGLAHVRLSWSTVSGATGYEVYYQFLTFTPLSVYNTTSTTINITSGLFRGITYIFYVVSYESASLPSGNVSVMLTISDPVVNDFMARLNTSTSITLTWSPPTALVPISYNINRRCRRVCESSVTSNSETSVLSPHTLTGIPPYSQCGFDLIGVYGAEIVYLTTNYLATATHSTAPTGSVGDIIFSSVESVSMTVSWDEVPCNGRNGPITGYYLTYTNITSNTSYTVNITGGDNRMYNLTGLIPYTNYTLSIIPYNYNMNGPARQEIQLTAESSKVTEISISLT
uniref:Fibronectin type-III domain-containing protein n=1 Tax=Amphimedon queenslandica TaxID=400682 RepID=A0A1X7SS49_AMPQE